MLSDLSKSQEQVSDTFGDSKIFNALAQVMIHSNYAWAPSTGGCDKAVDLYHKKTPVEGMLVVMKYNHVPYGASIWPAFWLMNSDNVWNLALRLWILRFLSFYGATAGLRARVEPNLVYLVSFAKPPWRLGSKCVVLCSVARSADRPKRAEFQGQRGENLILWSTPMTRREHESYVELPAHKSNSLNIG